MMVPAVARLTAARVTLLWSDCPSSTSTPSTGNLWPRGRSLGTYLATTRVNIRQSRALVSCVCAPVELHVVLVPLDRVELVPALGIVAHQPHPVTNLNQHCLNQEQTCRPCLTRTQLFKFTHNPTATTFCLFLVITVRESHYYIFLLLLFNPNT